MAKNTLTKDELRHDPLQDWFFHAVDYVHKRRRWFIAGGVAVAVVVAAGAGYALYATIHAQRVAARFNAAEARFLDASLPEADRIARSREAFRSFLEDYGASALAPYAWMHLARIAAQEKAFEEAEAAFRSAIDHAATPSSLRAIAQTALAKLYEDRGQLERSAQIYRALTGEPFGDLAEFSLARLALAQQDAKQARTHLEAVRQQYPQSSLAALARDVLIFVH
jgi:predicted negative regulator of RcsB-dependent stress response